MLDPFLRLDRFRWRLDDGDEANATWAADLNVNPAAPIDIQLRVRMNLFEVNNSVARSSAFDLIQRINGGPWLTSADPLSSKAMQLFDSTWIAPGEISTTQQISAPDAFTSGQIFDTGSVPFNITIDGNTSCEFEFAMEFILENVDQAYSVGDTIELAMVYEDLTLLEEYALLPTIVADDPLVFISKIFLGATRLTDIQWGNAGKVPAIYYGSTQVY